MAAAVAAVTLSGLMVVPAAAAQVTGASAAARGAASTSCPWVTSTAPTSQRVAQLMGQMSLSQKISMVEGHGTSNPYVFYTPAISSLCIPAMGLEDGPAGVADGLTGVTQLPASVALAATWDSSLAQQYGQVIGTEEFGKGASANLGPTVNIDRDPRWGRSFEALSEDPFLNSALDVPEINGVQAQDVMSQVKHFDAYNQETYRNTSADNVIVDNRALQEIYMPSFNAAVTQANSASVMCAYSMVNGNFSCDNSYLNNAVLRDQWGFPGFVTSDYGALHSTQGALQGTDMEQPESTYYGTALQSAIRKGTIPLSALNTMVQRILTEMFQYNLFNQPRTGSTSATVTTPTDVAVATSVAEAGTTLLKNAGSVLPLSVTNGGTIAVIGPSASVSPTYAGGGSAYVIPSSTVTPLAGIQAAAGSGTNVVYSQGLPTDTSLPAIPSSNLSPAYSSTPSGGSYTGTLTAPTTGTYVLALTNPCGCYTPTYLSLNGQRILDDPSTPPVHTYSVAVSLTAGQQYTLSISGQSSQLLWGTPAALAPDINAAVSAAQSAAAAVVVVSDDTESEAADRLSLNLPSAQDELISAVAAANPHTIVVINAGAPIAMPWLSQVAGVIDAW
ncbi:MAG TPA: glycoside hydrolase family 3 N-terminal domain-containing protein, partial [Trebonia sp.]